MLFDDVLVTVSLVRRDFALNDLSFEALSFAAWCVQ